MSKKKLLDLIAKKEARKAELSTKAATSEDIKELRSINTEVEAINSEITELRSLADSMPDDKTDPSNSANATNLGNPRDTNLQPEGRGATQIPLGQFNPLGTYGAAPTPSAIATSERRAVDDILKMPISTPEQQAEMRNELFKTPEYRSAFFKTLQGKPDSSLSEVEKRAITTAAGSGGAAIPTITYDLIIKRMQQTSALFGSISKTYLPGNVVLPVANPQIAASWSDVAPASLTTDSANDDTLSQVSLGSYALSKFAAIKGQVILMAIDAFETYIVSAIADQLAIAIENAILNGTGVNQPTGILSGVTFDASNSATWAAGSNVSYDDLVNARALLGLYRTPSARWIFNQNMEAQIFKIKSTINQPLFTQNPITGLISNPLGIPYVVDYYMPDNVILLANLDYYYMNINQNPTITSDESAGYLSTSRIYRGTMYLDAKPTISKAFVKISQAAA